MDLTISYMDSKSIKSKDDWNIEYLKVKEQYDLNKALLFMKNMVASVEIIKDKEIKKCYFIIPFAGHFLTDNIKEHIVYKTNRNSGKERIQFLIENIGQYKQEMTWRQRIYRHKVKNYFMLKAKAFFHFVRS